MHSLFHWCFVMGGCLLAGTLSARAQTQIETVVDPSAESESVSSHELVADDGDSTTSAGGEKAGEGPVLELEGLDTEALSGAAASPTETTVGDRFAGRVVKTATLAERAAAILDRTTLGGYGQHEYMAGRTEVARFRNHRYVLFIYSQISERITHATEIEWEFAGSPLKKDGELSAGEVLLEFSIVDFKLWDWLVFRGGVILVPESFNLRHDSPTRDLVDRPIAYTTILPSTWFESGVGLHGKLNLGEMQRLTYELYLINGLDARIFDGFGLRAARGSHFEDNNQDKALTGRLAWSPALGVELGIFGYSGEYDKADNRINMVNVDFMWRRGALELLGEAVYVSIDQGFVEGFSASSSANTRDAVPESMWGFYGQVNYHFQIGPLWELLPDDLKNATFTTALRYGGKDTDRARDSAAGDQRRMTLGLNFRPIEAFVWKFDSQWNSKGIDGKRGAAEVWEGRFWRKRAWGFLPDRFIGSVAYLF